MYQATTDDFTLVLKIIAGLQQGQTSHSIRQDVASDILTLLRADYLASYVMNNRTGRFEDGIALNVDAAHLARYHAYYQLHDPITPLMQQLRKATLVSQVIDQAALERTEFFNDFLKPSGLHHGVDMHLFDGDDNVGDLRIWRQKAQPEFGVREVALLDMLRPHLLGALRQQRQLQMERHARQNWQTLWERHPDPSFVVDMDGKELDRNRSATQLIGRLDQAESAALGTLLQQQARHGGEQGAIWGDFVVSVAHGEPGPGATMLLQLAPKNRRMIAERDLCQYFGLTSREAEVCVLVLQGHSDKEIARTLGIGFPTVRTHLTHIFSKTGVTSRSELTHRVNFGAH